MIKTLFTIIYFFAVLPAFAGGGMTHMFIAQESINLVQDVALQNLLRTHFDEFLVGAYYPDSGYMAGARYGEVSHTQDFLDAFATYLKAKYKNPIVEAPKMVAFLMGCAAHYRSDRILHFEFYDYVKDHDFNGDYKKAHPYADTGIDLLLDVEKNKLLRKPKQWWVPVKDLLAIYSLMGRNEYTENEITQGNLIISIAGTGERMISYPSYPYLRYWRMPWTTTHYYNWPNGGLINNITEVAIKETSTWQQLKDPNPKLSLSSHPNIKDIDEALADMPIYRFAQEALLTGAMKALPVVQPDGSVQWPDPIVQDVIQLQKLVSKLYAEFQHL